MKITILLAALLLSACAQVVPYVAKPGISNPSSVIEQALMEQKEDRRPEFVRVTGEYVEFGKNTTGEINGFTGKTSVHRNVTRLYWRSVHTSTVYTKRANVIIQFRSAQGSLLAQVVTDDVTKGEQLIDAVETMKINE